MKRRAARALFVCMLCVFFLLSSSRTYGAALRGVNEFCHRWISMNVLSEDLVHRKVSALCSVSMQTGLVRLCAFSQSLRVSWELLARETVHVGAETFSSAVPVQISDTRRVIKVNALHMQNASNQARGTMQNVIRQTRFGFKGTKLRVSVWKISSGNAPTPSALSRTA